MIKHASEETPIAWQQRQINARQQCVRTATAAYRLRVEVQNYWTALSPCCPLLLGLPLLYCRTCIGLHVSCRGQFTLSLTLVGNMFPTKTSLSQSLQPGPGLRHFRLYCRRLVCHFVCRRHKTDHPSPIKAMQYTVVN